MGWSEVLVAFIAFGAGGGGTALIQGLLTRRRETAQVEQITTAAHSAIYKEYGTLIAELRKDAELAREQARGALQEAREAQLRAGEAEARAAGAESRASAAEAQLREMARLVQMHVPDAEQILRDFGQLLTVKSRKPA